MIESCLNWLDLLLHAGGGFAILKVKEGRRKMADTYLLKTRLARRLYAEYAQELPIVDFHNHLSVLDMAADRRFENLYELWLATDPYKHRLMRIMGVEERYITGDASPYEKLSKYCEIFPLLIGTPVYDWSRMELSRIFGITVCPTRETAGRIWDRTAEMLASPEFSSRAILSRFGIEYQSPVASLFDDLAPYRAAGVAPSLRGDDLLDPTPERRAALSRMTGCAVTDPASYLFAVGLRLDEFRAAGCAFADHALDAGFFEGDTDGARQRMLTCLGVEYKKRGFTLLLHLDAMRKTSTRLACLAGPAGGYAAVGGRFPLDALCRLLDAMEGAGGLPTTVLFPLNPADQPLLSVMEGSFSEDGVAAKISLGPAWWWCDHEAGIRSTLDSVASYGVLSRFLGMTTDSRSILSFVRHDYFRRVLASWLAERFGGGSYRSSSRELGRLMRLLCYENAKEKIKI